MLILFTFFVFIGTSLSADQNVQEIPTPADYDQIDSIVQHHIDHEYFSGVVLMANDGNTEYFKSAGSRQLNKEEKITPETVFSIASITKMLTAILILQLEEEGKLSVHDPLDKWLPEFPIPNNQEITLHHLLLHISGLPNEDDAIFNQSVFPTDFVNQTLSQGNQKEVGHFNYANIDYILLGLVIEKITGQSWETSITERILEPLEMDNTGCLEKGIYPQDFAYTYQIDEEGNARPDHKIHIENYWAAGNMYSNAQDILKLDQALYDHHFLSESSKEKMFTSYPEYNYTGYSVWTYRYPFLDSQPLLMERRGGILGANVVLVRLLEQNKTIIILSNNNRFDTNTFGNKENLKEALIIAYD